VTKIIDGTKISEIIRAEIHNQVRRLKGRAPCLAVIIVGENPSSRIYVISKRKACEIAGITSIQIDLPADVTENTLVAAIEQLNHRNDVDGILLQLPLPQHLNPAFIISKIDPTKDVDGLHPLNAGKLLLGETDGFVPCTPLGVQHLLIDTMGSIVGKRVLILGRSSIVGKPLAALLMQNNAKANATVTLAHSKSVALESLCKESDVIVAAMGQPLFIKGSMIKPGAVLIDVGINRIPDSSTPKGYKIVGDIDETSALPLCGALTPVPKGVGPMTIAMLLHNTLLSYQRRCAI
jgi:methylenetetrahydrofolate dehydrogenase (NADP+)/methenyltetrahydrofolate cyclohydrolase